MPTPHCGVGQWMLICTDTLQRDAEKPRATNTSNGCSWKPEVLLLLLEDEHSEGADLGPDRAVELSIHLNIESIYFYETMSNVIFYILCVIYWINNHRHTHTHTPLGMNMRVFQKRRTEQTRPILNMNSTLRGPGCKTDYRRTGKKTVSIQLSASWPMVRWDQLPHGSATTPSIMMDYIPLNCEVNHPFIP